MALKSWIQAARPKTLSAAWVPVITATAWAYKINGQISATTFVATLAASICIQIATNFFNDAIDFKKGSDTEIRLGPARVTHTGAIASRDVMRAGWFMLVAASLLGLYLVSVGGPWILVIGSASGFLAYGYTGGPWPLAYKGLGEIFVLLFFGFISVMGTYWLQSPETFHFAKIPLVLTSLQVGLLAVALIAINNLRDINEDRGTGKKTLAVRIGLKPMKATIIFSLIFPFLLLQAQFHYLLSLMAFLPLVSLPIALNLISKISTSEPSAKYNSYLAQAGLLQTLFGLLLTIGLFSS